MWDSTTQTSMSTIRLSPLTSIGIASGRPTWCPLQWNPLSMRKCEFVQHIMQRFFSIHRILILVSHVLTLQWTWSLVLFGFWQPHPYPWRGSTGMDKVCSLSKRWGTSVFRIVSNFLLHTANDHIRNGTIVNYWGNYYEIQYGPGNNGNGEGKWSPHTLSVKLLPRKL